MIKLTFCLVRLPHLDRAEFQRYWREHHAPLVRSHAKALRLRRYVQSHALPEDAAPWLAKTRGAPEGFDGVAELWWDSMADFTHRSPEAAAAGAALLEDEKKFIDLARSPLFITEEFVALDETA
ncbi:EthD domain-containing protein [Camelimonas abortus]|uniref:EthD domain-containing protein n=1 Tax=Camelimonas abortus TaxID=1017184 RepID=A0ABV7LD92_9HYPH